MQRKIYARLTFNTIVDELPWRVVLQPLVVSNSALTRFMTIYQVFGYEIDMNHIYDDALVHRRHRCTLSECDIIETTVTKMPDTG